MHYVIKQNYFKQYMKGLLYEFASLSTIEADLHIRQQMNSSATCFLFFLVKI